MATISITAQDVRDAGDLDESDHSDGSLQFEISQAVAIVNDDLAPHTDKTNRLELVAALIAAAYVKDERHISSVQQGSRRASFNAGESLSLWRQATQLDPTGKLAGLEDEDDFWIVGG